MDSAAPCYKGVGVGRKKRPAPKKLAQKLTALRESLGLTQEETLVKVCPWLEPSARSVISEYENGKRVPSLIEMLNYAKLAGVSVDFLINDEISIDFKKKR